MRKLQIIAILFLLTFDGQGLSESQRPPSASKSDKNNIESTELRAIAQKGTDSTPFVIKIIPTPVETGKTQSNYNETKDKGNREVTANIIAGLTALILLGQTFYFRSQAKRLKETIELQRAWVFAGIGCTSIIRPGVVLAHPDHSNNGGSPAFVDYVYINTWPKSQPLPENPDYSNPANIYAIMDPIQVGRTFKPIHRIEEKELNNITEDTYVYGHIFYRNFFDKGPQRYSSFIYIIRGPIRVRSTLLTEATQQNLQQYRSLDTINAMRYHRQ